MRVRRFSLTNFICVLLIIFTIVPDVGIKFAAFGFTWTAYRLMIALTAVGVIVGRGKISFDKTMPLTKWVLFMIVWTAYGLVLLFVGKYTIFHSGFVEWLSIFNGTVVIYAMSLFLKTEKNRAAAVRLLFWLLNLLLLIGFLEILTGRHWITSAFRDPKSSIYWYSNHRQATGLMYNMNDFSAMITCMSPILVDRRLGKARFLSLAGILVINLFNDATTCTFAILVFLLYYFLILRGGSSSRAVALKIVFWFLVAAAAAVVFIIAPGLVTRNDFLGAVARQISNARQSSGSLFRRITIYKDALSALVSSGMLGMGPSGFTTYFTLYPSTSNLVNPHALIFEVLTQYGVVIGLWFAALLVWMFLSAKKQYRQGSPDEKNGAVMVIAFVIVYFIASFAPSTFIGYSYQWLLIAVMGSQLHSGTEASVETESARPRLSTAATAPKET